MDFEQHCKTDECSEISVKLHGAYGTCEYNLLKKITPIFCGFEGFEALICVKIRRKKVWITLIFNGTPKRIQARKSCSEIYMN